MKKNIFIIILAFLVVGLAGFITYDNFFKPSTKCDSNNTKTSTVTKDSKKADSKTTETADERYKAYLENLAKSIQKKYVDPHAGEDNYLSAELNNYTVVEKVDFDGYTISINNKLELIIGGKKLSDKAVSYYNIHTGNGPFSLVYFITTEGKVYSADYEIAHGETREPTVKEITGVKNIIEVKEGNSLAGVPIYVDIDGNMFTPDIVE